MLLFVYLRRGIYAQDAPRCCATGARLMPRERYYKRRHLRYLRHMFLPLLRRHTPLLPFDDVAAAALLMLISPHAMLLLD